MSTTTTVPASSAVKNKSKQYKTKLKEWINLFKKISSLRIYTTVSSMKAYLFGSEEDWVEELFVVHHRIKQEKREVGPDVIGYFKNGNRCTLQYDSEFNIQSLNAQPYFMRAIESRSGNTSINKDIDTFETDWETGYYIIKNYVSSVASIDALLLPPPWGIK